MYLEFNSKYRCSSGIFKIFLSYILLFSYTRNLVDEGNGKFNLMLLCWGEGHGSAVHDHADAHCFMKMMDGTLNEIRFAWPKSTSATDSSEVQSENTNEEIVQGLEKIGSTLLETNGVVYINGECT